MTALALCGALALTASCASNSGGTGGATGSNGGSGTAGSTGTAGSSGTAGSTGTGNTAGGGNTVTFSAGQAQGPMTGYAYVALGPQDTLSDPVCNPTATAGGSTQPITNATPCPSTGQTVWKNTTDLCMSGTIPVVQDDTAFPTGDYTADWGVQIGVNTSNPPATAAGSGTLGTTYSRITLTTTGTVTPTNNAIRAIIHLVSMPSTANPYCATMTSGTSINLTSFNTACWDGTGTSLLATDIPNIDKIGVQISSDTTNAYTVSNFCLESIAFTP